MLLKLLLVAASALLSSLVAKRFGHAVGGTLAGLPMIAGPIMGFVLWATPVEGVRAIALATLVCLPATVAHLVTFAWSGTRWPWWLSLALANLAFFGLGMLMPQLGLPAWLVCLLALAVLALGGVAMLWEGQPRGSAEDLAALALRIKALPIRLQRARPLAEAISTAGGVRLEALDDGLMLKALPGTFVAGEMIDWEAPTGGYLLTGCLATGHAAGEGVLRWLGG